MPPVSFKAASEKCVQSDQLNDQFIVGGGYGALEAGFSIFLVCLCVLNK